MRELLTTANPSDLIADVEDNNLAEGFVNLGINLDNIIKLF